MYGKSWAAIAYALVITLQAALGGDGNVEVDEWVQIAIAVVTAVSVYMVPITTQYKWVKTGVAVVLAILQGVATVLLGGWEPNDWLTLLITGLGALAVLLAPATSINPSGTGDVSVPVGSDR
jgi:hypothetical protein